MKTGARPWLHELTHVILETKAGDWDSSGMTEEEVNKRIPLWLTEGLADYISLEVSLKNGWPRYDVMSRSFATNVDSLFRQEVKSEQGRKVLNYIGSGGAMPELFSDERPLYAPCFYHGSCSFVKYLADHFGLDVLLTGIASFAHEQTAIEQQTGKSLSELKQLWLNSLSH